MASKIYTKTGDNGTSAILGGTRLSKDHTIFEITGNIDELSSIIGVIRSSIPDDLKLAEIQSILFHMGAWVGSDGAKFDRSKLRQITEDDVLKLEGWIDSMQSILPPLKNFILPIGMIHYARAVCRRVERRVVGYDEAIVKYLNRLSDYLFVYARYVDFKEWKSKHSLMPIESYQEPTISQL